MANVFNENEYNWQDSWKRDTVQLAALGAIAAGAGHMAVRGDLTDAIQQGKRVGGTLGRGFDNYMKKRTAPGIRLVYNIGKGTFKRLARMNPDIKSGDQRLTEIAQRALTDFNPGSEMDKKIRMEVAKRLRGAAGNIQKVNQVLDGKKLPNIDEAQLIREIYEQVKGEEVRKIIGAASPNLNTAPINSPSKEKVPFLQKGELRKRLVVDGLGGVAFAAGLTGVHAVDRAMTKKDNEKKVEDSFEFSGSFINNKRDKGDKRNMDKRASSLELYNRLKQIGGKTPDALASGVGYTGASLLAAGTLGADPRFARSKKDEDKSNGPRVIIELGDEDPSEMNNAQPGVNMSLPKLSSQDDEKIEKLAFPKMSPKLKSFVQDFKGYDNEVRALEGQNFQAQATEQLKDADIPSLLQQRFGNLVNDKSEAQYRGRLLDATADDLKRKADDEILSLRQREADARLKGGGAALLAGGGLAGMAANRRKKEQENG